MVPISKTHTKFDSSSDSQDTEWKDDVKSVLIERSFWMDNQEEVVYILCFLLGCVILHFIVVRCGIIHGHNLIIRFPWFFRFFFDNRVELNPVPRDNNRQQIRYRDNRIYWNDDALQYPLEDEL